LAEAADERRISLVLRAETIQRLDELRQQWSLRSRGQAIQRVLDDVLADLEQDDDEEIDVEGQEHVDGALVLLADANPGDATSEDDNEPDGPDPSQRSGGINLPGFVSKRTSELRRSLKEPRISEAQALGDRFEVMDSQQLNSAMHSVQQHWMALYGSEPSAAVLEASMHWLSRDIWPAADAAEGQTFTWNAVQQVML
jgi:hypothetical protein